MIEYDPDKPLDDQLAEMQDAPDRIASALIALSNDDGAGAQAVLDGADPDVLLSILLNLSANLGLRHYGKRAFARTLRRWADDVRALDPHDPWGQKKARGEGHDQG